MRTISIIIFLISIFNLLLIDSCRNPNIQQCLTCSGDCPKTGKEGIWVCEGFPHEDVLCARQRIKYDDSTIEQLEEAKQLYELAGYTCHFTEYCDRCGQLN